VIILYQTAVAIIQQKHMKKSSLMLQIQLAQELISLNISGILVTEQQHMEKQSHTAMIQKEYIL
jgi:hypothetical protein